MSNGRVYWITGLANAGKTTIGTALYYDLKKRRQNVIILDGELMKEIASGSALSNYEEADRHIRAKRYSMMAKLLSDQGMWVIVCAIAMFDDIREWNRKNISGYIEVFLDVPKAVLESRDYMGLYRYEPYMQFPKNPDIRITNDGTISILEIVDSVKALKPINEDDYTRDRKYWNSYYKENKCSISKCSDFAIEVNKKLEKNSRILELGCGNGRDSLYFLSQGHNVIGLDASDIAIDRLNSITQKNSEALFVCDDFVKCHALYQKKYDCVYSRFTLHAINERQEDELLRNIKSSLSTGGMLCIEARTVHDDIYGKGKSLGNNAFEYNGHYRRFIDVDKFKKKVENMGFKIDYLAERNGFSKTDDSDPVLMRLIAHVNPVC